MSDLIINGKIYPLWQQFVQRKTEWIGGILQDCDDDPMLGGAQCLIWPRDQQFVEMVGKDRVVVD